MRKIARRNGLLVSLVVIEEQCAKDLGLQQWRCNCGLTFLTYYYCSFHVEKHHPGENLQDQISMIDVSKSDRKKWESLYSVVSDNIYFTIGNKPSLENVTPAPSRSVAESSTQTISPILADKAISVDFVNSTSHDPGVNKRSLPMEAKITEVKRAKIVDVAEDLSVTEHTEANLDKMAISPISASPEPQITENSDRTTSVNLTTPSRYTAKQIFKAHSNPQVATVLPTFCMKIPTKLPFVNKLPSDESPTSTPSKKKKTTETRENPGAERGFSTNRTMNIPIKSISLYLPSPSYYDPEENEEMPPAKFVSRPRKLTNLESSQTYSKKSRTPRKRAISNSETDDEDGEVLEVSFLNKETERIGMELRKEPTEADEVLKMQERLERHMSTEESFTQNKECLAKDSASSMMKKNPEFIAGRSKACITLTRSEEALIADPRCSEHLSESSVYRNSYQPNNEFDTFQCYVDLLKKKKEVQEPHNDLMSHTNTPSDADIASTSASALTTPTQRPESVPPPPAEPNYYYGAEGYSAAYSGVYNTGYEYYQYGPPMVQGRTMLIPDPRYFPYPDFRLLFPKDSLFHPDGAPRLLQLNKWENFYVYAWKHNLDPYEAHDFWIKKFAPNAPTYKEASASTS